MNINKLEVLAPAGDEERFNAAINYGADAVYLGRKQFGMRSSTRLISILNSSLRLSMLLMQRA